MNSCIIIIVIINTLFAVRGTGTFQVKTFRFDFSFFCFFTGGVKSSYCTDYKGFTIHDGQTFSPLDNPCKICTCVDSKPTNCDVKQCKDLTKEVLMSFFCFFFNCFYERSHTSYFSIWNSHKFKNIIYSPSFCKKYNSIIIYIIHTYYMLLIVCVIHKGFREWKV